MTLWSAQERSLTLIAGDVNAETMAVMLGIDVARLREQDPPTMSMQVSGRLLRRPVAPRKAKGLTGKRYRIARRRYARLMKAYRHGVGDRVDVHYFVPRASVDHVVRETLMAKIKGYSAQFTVMDEASAMSPQDAKPGYSEES